MAGKRKRDSALQEVPNTTTSIPGSPSKPGKASSPAKKAPTGKASKGKLPQKINDFTLLPLLLPAAANLPPAVHYLYLRAHAGPSSASSAAGPASAGEELPRGHTLFVVNLPADMGERELRKLAGRWGVVERVLIRGGEGGAESAGGVEEDDVEDEDMEDPEEEEEDLSSDDRSGRACKPRRTKSKDPTVQVTPLPPLPPMPHRAALSAHVVFLDAASLQAALRPISSPIAYDRPAFGLQHYIALHGALRPPLEAVRAHADSYIAAFEQRQAAGKQTGKYKMGEAEVDQDGFTVVRRGGKYGKALGGVPVASRAEENRKGRGRKKKARRAAGAVEDFYRFQVREKKRKEFGELRSRFERDKERVRGMREGGRFRPY
ncbi:hypothetical protein CALCODRAFT_428783 [Calocera cornea HHB12733]|uniref:RRM domain-containing protein n=1 Tax=Calocera cornea HHB12733 TaxID=1353952 RepID=A0A165IMK8_9BASI|nr:hypothetical protein CALCODRAFT_428783 [Calocera cornea HHB12733]